MWLYKSDGVAAKSSNPYLPLPKTPMSSSAHTAANGNGTKAGSLEATNSITTSEGLTHVRARIDPTLPVNDVVKQLCASLKIRESPSHFALKDEGGEVVTDDNLKSKIENKCNLM